MTNAEARINDEARMGRGHKYPGYLGIVIPFTCSSRFSRRLDAVLSPRTRAYEPLVLIPVLHERSFEGNAWFRALLSGRSQWFSGIPFWKLRHQLRRNWRQH